MSFAESLLWKIRDAFRDRDAARLHYSWHPDD
jgi:hypothetical protein